MRTRIHACLLTCIAMSLALAAALPAHSKGVTLRYKQSQGDRAVYKFASSARARIDVQQGLTTSQAEMSLQMSVSTEVTDISPEGDLRIQAQITSGGMKLKAEGEQSTAPVENVVVNYMISPQAGVRNAELVAGNPPMFPGIFLAFMPDDAFLLGGLAQLPAKPLSPGETWSGTAHVPTGDGETEDVPYKSKLLGMVQFRGRPCAKIRTMAKVTETSTEDAPDGSGTMTAKATITRDTTWLLDYERGVSMSADSTDRLSLTLEGTDETGENSTATISGALNSRAQLLEFNGQKLPAK